ncbi:DUF3099 domain-containing protein [Pseudoglutamicibacter cumminsii]|uniref:DUF3099 domain-containing protein n=1 Tax=Pseudoglutamicibacter cumminsii TaxID=156979 RepID=UPI0021A7EDE8|nr:DUF3099 domain-containing protein [Pseudoglutamicibacter cumminsii]MCT1686853.1 DUF3099 domain-containing protein [Pseudoglutamicibacter cumminsii]
MAKKEATAPAEYSITDAQEAASLEARHRHRMYALKMTLRVICFPLGGILAYYVNIWLGLGLLIFATIIPWFAVVSANAIQPSSTVDPTWADKQVPTELPTSYVDASTRAAGDDNASEQVIQIHSEQHQRARSGNADSSGSESSGSEGRA